MILSLRKHESSKLPALILLSRAILSCELISTIPTQNNHEFRKMVFAVVVPAFVCAVLGSSGRVPKAQLFPPSFPNRSLFRLCGLQLLEKMAYAAWFYRKSLVSGVQRLQIMFPGLLLVIFGVRCIPRPKHSYLRQ